MMELHDELPPGMFLVLTRRRGVIPFFENEALRLRTHPGKWGRVAKRGTKDRAERLAHKIRSGYYAAFKPRHSFEAAVSESFEVWARYVGPDGSQEVRSQMA